jgi:hypothetical protein
MRAFLSIIALLFALPLFADGDGTSRKIAQAGKPMPKAAAQPEVNEGDVLEFVREHHEELADLLDQLKASRPKEYQKAVRDLSRVRERLRLMKTTDDQRYQLELSIWKTETKIQLLAARLSMGDKSEARDQLRQALNEQIDLRLSLLKHEREVAQERVSRLDAQIEKLDKERSQVIDKQLQNLTKAADAKPAEKPVKKPADSKPKPTPEKPAKKP